MKTKRNAGAGAMLMLIIYLTNAIPSNATIIEISTATDKAIYSLGEEIEVFITAYNPSDELITLYFSTSEQASYLMDNTYDWKDYHGEWLFATEQEIGPYSSYTWTLVHGEDELIDYAPAAGNHNVIGEVIGYGQSTSIEFEVVPEPATVVLFGLGGLFVKNFINRKIT